MRDSEEFPVADVTVDVNGVEATTDVHGRYIAEYVGSDAREVDDEDYDDHVFVETDHEDNKATQDIVAFAANSRIQQDVVVSGVGRTAAISGTVTASGSGAPVAGAEILVDGVAPTNAATSGANEGKLVTGADGSYRAVIVAKDVGETADVSVTKEGHELRACEADCSGSRRCGYLGHQLHRLRARHDYGQGEGSGRQRHGRR